MKGNNSGRGASLTLALILIVALVAAWLAVTQFRSLRVSPDAAPDQPTANPVQQARDAVDALNEGMRTAAEP